MEGSLLLNQMWTLKSIHVLKDVSIQLARWVTPQKKTCWDKSWCQRSPVFKAFTRGEKECMENRSRNHLLSSEVSCELSFKMTYIAKTCVEVLSSRHGWSYRWGGDCYAQLAPPQLSGSKLLLHQLRSSLIVILVRAEGPVFPTVSSVEAACTYSTIYADV